MLQASKVTQDRRDLSLTRHLIQSRENVKMNS